MDSKKIRDVFPDMAVLKNPKRTEFFSNLSLPSYMRDWLVMKFSDATGETDIERVAAYIKTYIPSREDFEQMNRLPAASYGVSRYWVTKAPQGAGNEPGWRDALIAGARSAWVQRHAGSNTG